MLKKFPLQFFLKIIKVRLFNLKKNKKVFSHPDILSFYMEQMKAVVNYWEEESFASPASLEEQELPTCPNWRLKRKITALKIPSKEMFF